MYRKPFAMHTIDYGSYQIFLDQPRVVIYILFLLFIIKKINVGMPNYRNTQQSKRCQIFSFYLFLITFSLLFFLFFIFLGSRSCHFCFNLDMSTCADEG